MSCRHHWIERDYRSQVCIKCKRARGHFLPDGKPAGGWPTDKAAMRPYSLRSKRSAITPPKEKA